MRRDYTRRQPIRLRGGESTSITLEPESLALMQIKGRATVSLTGQANRLRLNRDRIR
jgi:hypothetical protein